MSAASLALGAFVAASLLLVVSGVAKWRTPSPTVPVLRALGHAATPRSVRLLACAEILIGGSALVGLAGTFSSTVTQATATALAFAYFALAVVAAKLLSDGTGGDCGCFGTSWAPVTGLHVVVNLAAGLSAAIVVAQPASVRALVSADPSTAALVASVVALTAATRLVLSDSAALAALVREGER